MSKKSKKKLTGGSANHRVPQGLVGKGHRLALQPPGHPSGHHDPKMFKEVLEDGKKVRTNLCRCGKCNRQK